MIPVARWVAPFGHPGIKARSQLPQDFRSVPRPSSPLGAKASTRCPSLAQTLNAATEITASHHHAQEQPTRPDPPLAGQTQTVDAQHGATQRILSTFIQTPLNPAAAQPCGQQPPKQGSNQTGSDKHSRQSRHGHTQPAPNHPAYNEAVQNHPSRPARPGAHQNQIHTVTKTTTRHTKPTARHHAAPHTTVHRSTLHNHDKTPSGPHHQDTSPNHPTPAPKGWRRTGSNRRPPACKAGALPAELRPHRLQPSPRAMATKPNPQGRTANGGPGRI